MTKDTLPPWAKQATDWAKQAIEMPEAPAPAPVVAEPNHGRVCRVCRWFSVGRRPPEGECRYAPPGPQGFPTVLESAWCREFCAADGAFGPGIAIGGAERK